MNMLNSFIIEGTVIEDAVYDTALYCSFNISHVRKCKIDGKDTEEENVFPIIVYGKTAEFASAKATKGRGVRVVGRIRVVSDKKWFVVAEHIEYKPLENKQKENRYEYFE